jgi:hypothetical protein
MINSLVTYFFNEIEKKELKKNKNAQAIFWVEELQKITATDKNYISVKKATRLYNKYVDNNKKTVVKEPNKYLLDFMSQYLGFKDYEDYKSIKGSKGEIITHEKQIIIKNSKKKLLTKKHKKLIITSSVLFTLLVLLIINKYNNSNSENCIIWVENHFEKSDCITEKAIDNSVYNIDIENFEKVEVTENTSFFKDDNPLFWYGKSATGKMEFFTNRGIHPETLDELKPVTEYIINKYVLKDNTDKTIIE